MFNVQQWREKAKTQSSSLAACRPPWGLWGALTVHMKHLNREMAKPGDWTQTAWDPTSLGARRRQERGQNALLQARHKPAKVPALENLRRHSLLFVNTDSASAEREVPLVSALGTQIALPQAQPCFMPSSLHKKSRYGKVLWGPSGDSLLKQVFIRGVHSSRLNRVCR